MDNDTDAGIDPASLLREGGASRFGQEIRRVLHDIAQANDAPALEQAAERMRTIVHGLVEQAPAQQHTRVISAFSDSLTRRIIAVTAATAVPPKARWCWVALGSEARQEQTMASDQDNAILFDGPACADAIRESLLPLALRINHTLDRCGYPLCPGNIMASNPKWCLHLHEWRERFMDWIDEGNPEALLNATIFFDLRPLHGALELARGLISWLGATAAENRRFLFLMADNALRRKPPLGFFQDFAVDRDGRFAGTIDLKVNGITLFVDAARLYGLRCALDVANTEERLALAGERLSIPRGEVRGWIEAFRFIQMLRLKHQQACHARGRPMHNHIDPHSLNASDRQALRDALRQARALQRRVSLDFLGGGRPY